MSAYRYFADKYSLWRAAGDRVQIRPHNGYKWERSVFTSADELAKEEGVVELKDEETPS